MASHMASLSGRVALVTGAGSGIGAATARLLAAQGALVYCGDLKVSEVQGGDREGSTDARLASLRLDVRNEADCAA